MKRKLFLLVLLSIFFTSNNVLAKVSGQCANCHTMHNSQTNSPMSVDINGDADPSLNRALTKGDCVGCHTGVNGTDVATIPYVVSTSKSGYGPDYGEDGLIDNDANNTLAGGTFNYVSASDANGHNVVGIDDGADAIGFTPPGWIYNTFNNGVEGSVIGDETTWAKQLTCAGTYGCHGNHLQEDDFADISGAHHADDSIIDGLSVAKSYRFLRGILGVEDSRWEYEVTTTNHNIYKGADRANTTTTAMDKTTISYLCAQCHGLFHSNDGSTENSGIISSSTTINNSNPWLRHPTDFSLNKTSDGSEYRSYAGVDGTAGSYNYMAPLASKTPTVAASVTAINAGTINGTDDIVTCISCHRAHGSEYPDMLRWNYNMMSANSADTNFDNKGCFACHTTKD